MLKTTVFRSYFSPVVLSFSKEKLTEVKALSTISEPSESFSFRL